MLQPQQRADLQACVVFVCVFRAAGGAAGQGAARAAAAGPLCRGAREEDGGAEEEGTEAAGGSRGEETAAAGGRKGQRSPFYSSCLHSTEKTSSSFKNSVIKQPEISNKLRIPLIPSWSPQSDL